MNTEATILTRADWKSTFSTMPENRSKAVGDTYVASFGIEETFDPQTDPLLGNTETSIYADAAEGNVKDLGLKVSDMRGIPYNDAKWDEFLSQIDLTDAKERAAVVIFLALAVGGIVLMVRRTRDAKLHPEMYKGRKRKEK